MLKSLWETIKKIFKSIWYYIVVVGAGILAIFLLGKRDTPSPLIDKKKKEIEDLEKVKAKLLEDINKRELEGEEINKEIEQKIKDIEKRIEDIKNEKDIDNSIDNFNDAWNR